MGHVGVYLSTDGVGVNLNAAGYRAQHRTAVRRARPPQASRLFLRSGVGHGGEGTIAVGARALTTNQEVRASRSATASCHA